MKDACCCCLTYQLLPTKNERVRPQEHLIIYDQYMYVFVNKKCHTHRQNNCEPLTFQIVINKSFYIEVAKSRYFLLYSVRVHF